MEKIKLELTIDDANLILEALGALPFSKVFELIGTIQQQASQQLRQESPGNAAIGASNANDSTK